MFLFTGNLRAAAQMPAPSSSSIVHALPEPHVDYEKYILPNGLQVILVRNSRVLKVHVNLLDHVGSKNEPQDCTGLFAHLFEHMMFEGSKNATGHYANLIEAAGDEAGLHVWVPYLDGRHVFLRRLDRDRSRSDRQDKRIGR